ncbi:glycosyltransferase [bacterium]|nr:glycosyltransferase [bacterium]
MLSQVAVWENARSIRVVSNMPDLVSSPGGTRIANRAVWPCRAVWKDAIVFLTRSFGRCDVVLLYQPSHGLAAILGALRRLVPFWRCRFVVVDLIFTNPGTTLLGRLRAAVKRVCFRGIDRFLIFQKDVSAIRALYGIQPDQIRRISYFVKARGILHNIEVSEGGYVFSGGASRRDFKTFCLAMADLPCRGLLATPAPKVAAFHGTSLDERLVPSNVTVRRDIAQQSEWVNAIAGAKLVVITTHPDPVGGPGQTTYALAMALGKCVIITDSEVVRGLLVDGDNAILVPPSDPAALREAIRRAWEDDRLRHTIGTRAREYGLGLGGPDDFHSRVANEVVDLVQNGSGC